MFLKHFVSTFVISVKQRLKIIIMNNQLTTRVKHIFRENLFQANSLFTKNWFRLVVACLVAFIILHKDLNISFNLVNSDKQQQQMQPAVPVSQPEAQPTSFNTKPKKAEPTGESSTLTMKDMMKTSVISAKPAQKKIKKAKKTDSNLANTFSNIGFVLNPTYAKRNNIDPAIVAEKRRKLDAYVKRFAPIAVKEMKQFGIPASVTLAQGLLESNAGESRLAKGNNNHFGIKCFSKQCRAGHCSNYTDDSHKDFFRKYPSAEQSYRAHSEFLQRKRYKHLHELGTKNYKGWAHGLKKAGYATDKKYGPKLIKLIEALKLHRYDK